MCPRTKLSILQELSDESKEIRPPVSHVPVPVAEFRRKCLSDVLVKWNLCDGWHCFRPLFLSCSA